MGFPRLDYWRGLPFSSPWHLPNPGTEPNSPALAGGFFTTESPRKHILYFVCLQIQIHYSHRESGILSRLVDKVKFCSLLCNLKFSQFFKLILNNLTFWMFSDSFFHTYEIYTCRNIYTNIKHIYIYLTIKILCIIFIV